MRISAAVCTYNRYDLLAKTLSSLQHQSLSADDFEIVVIDNSPNSNRSTEESRKYASIKNLRWIYEEVAGLSNARNLAAKIVNAPIISFIDDDALADHVWLEKVLTAFEMLGPDVAVVGGRVRPWWGGERPDWLSDNLLGYLSCVDLGEDLRTLSEGEWVAGANISYRVTDLSNTGGFSVALGRVGSGSSLMSNEEIDVTDRLKAGGKKIAYSPDAAVAHWVDPSRISQQWFRRRMAWQAVSDYVRQPGLLEKNLDRSWEDVRRYVLQCPPHERTLRALSLSRDTAGEFQWQLSAIYNSVICLLGGLSEESYD